MAGWTKRDNRHKQTPLVAQLGRIVSAGGFLGVLMSIIYYRTFGAPRAWHEGRVFEHWSGIAGDADGTMKMTWNERKSPAGTGHAEIQESSESIVGPILSQDSDWPATWPGDPREYRDFLLVIYSGDDTSAMDKRDYMREIYDSYGEEIVIVDETGQKFLYTFKVLFVVGHPGASPDGGDISGDILYVDVPKGYRKIAGKTKKMLETVKHLRFKYLLKADDDTFVCLRRVASQMHLVPPHIKPKIYGGIPTACHLPNNPDRNVGKVIKDSSNKWYDEQYLNHTMNGLSCYPVYMQGAFYILSYPLVELLNQGSSRLLTFDNEDVTIGLWLHGVDRAIFPLNDLRDARLWTCSCKDPGFKPAWDANVFFHNCKFIQELQACKTALPLC